jgi:hypothetical protein
MFEWYDMNILVSKILGKALRSRGWKFYSIYVDNIFWKGEIFYSTNCNSVDNNLSKFKGGKFYSTNVDNNLSKFKVGEFEIEDEAV